MEIPKYYFKQSKFCPNSYSIFERDGINEFGEPYCVHPMLNYKQAKEWTDMLNSGIDPTKVDADKLDKISRIDKILWFCNEVCLADSCKGCPHKSILEKHGVNNEKF